MKEQKLSLNKFQAFYTSNETSKHPLKTGIIKLGKKIKKYNLIKDNSALISLSIGNQVLINTDVEDYSNIKDEEILEIVDYDPVKNNILLIGKKKPKLETPVHWMIHHARKDVGAIIQINNKDLIEKLKIKNPETKKEETGSFEQIKSVLYLLRDSKKIIIKNQGILCVGKTIKDIEEKLEELK